MKVFYGWRMVGAACGIQFLLAAFLTQALGLYIAVLSDEMGWSKTTLSGAAALQSVEAAIIGPVLGWVMDRVGPQKMIRLGMVLFSAGLLLLSQVSNTRCNILSFNHNDLCIYFTYFAPLYIIC